VRWSSYQYSDFAIIEKESAKIENPTSAVVAIKPTGESHMLLQKRGKGRVFITKTLFVQGAGAINEAIAALAAVPTRYFG